MGNSKSKPQPVANKLPDQPQERSDAVSQGPPPRNTPRERLPSGPPPRRTSPIIVHSKHSPPRLEIRHPASPREENTTRPSTNQTPATNERSPRGTSTSDIVWKEAQLIDGYPDREALHEMCSKMYGKGNFRVKVRLDKCFVLVKEGNPGKKLTKAQMKALSPPRPDSPCSSGY